jgi:thioredoxin-related protein
MAQVIEHNPHFEAAVKRGLDEQHNPGRLHEALFHFGNPMDRPAERHIDWSNSVLDSLKTAQIEHKPLVVVFEQDNCGWCKEFDKQLDKPQFVNAVGDQANFLRISPASDKDALALSNLVGVEGYPSAVVLEVSGGKVTPVSKYSGYHDADEFAISLQNAFNDIRQARSVET